MKVKVRRLSVSFPVTPDVAKDLTVILADLFVGSDLTVSIDTEKDLVTIAKKKSQGPYDN